jgi:hypothetical protein
LHPLLTPTSPINTLSNLYLSPKNGKIGAYAGTRESAQQAYRFFTTPYPSAGTLSIHAGDDARQVALSGKGGLLNLVDLASPSAATIDAAQTPTEWSVFTIGQGGAVGVSDGGSAVGGGGSGGSRTFVTYLETDGVYYVGLWDGVTKQPRTVSNVTLVATKVSAPKMK